MTKHLTQKQATEMWRQRIKEMQASMRKDMETKATYDGGEKYKEGPTGTNEAVPLIPLAVGAARMAAPAVARAVTKVGAPALATAPQAAMQVGKNIKKKVSSVASKIKTAYQDRKEDAAMDKARADFFKRGGKIKKLPDGPKYGHLDTNLAKGVKGLVKNTSKLGLKNRGRHLDTSTPVHKEELGMTAASAGIPHDTKNMGPRDVTDKRYKKDKPPVIKRGFKSYIGM